MHKRKASLLLSCLIPFLLLNAQISSANKAKDADENYGLAKEENQLPPTVITLSENERQKAALPSRYDARETGLITPVKDQCSFDLCWAYSTMSMAESNLIKKGLANSQIDLSEIQPHYFQWHSTPDPEGLISDDRNVWTAFETTPGKQREWINSWSTGYRAVFLLSSWRGVTEEAAVPHPNTDADIPGYTLSDDLAYNQDYAHLQNAFWVSATSQDVLKELILQYGSAVLTFHQEAQYYLNSENAAYYCPQKKDTNHLVNVIGWDDDYPADNFLEKPPQNGAWLIKNSFGTDWGDEGYFWLSYADQTIYTDAFVFDFEAADNYDHNYQYDGTVSYSFKIFPGTNEISGANVFVAQRAETLSAVGFVTPSYNFEYEISIFTDVDMLPDSGNKALNFFGKGLFSGYHTIKLPEAIPLKEGQKFSVIVRIYGTPNRLAYLMTDTSATYTRNNDQNGVSVYQQFDNTVRPGQSFFYTPEAGWSDCSSYSNEKDIVNVRIKAFTIDDEQKAITKALPSGAAEKVLFQPGSAQQKFIQLFSQPDGHSLDYPATGLSNSAVAVPAIASDSLAGNPLLQIPSLDISLPLIGMQKNETGFITQDLGAAAGLLQGSALPGEGLSLIAAHNHLNAAEAGPFLFIHKLEPGDRLFVRYADGRLVSFKVYANLLLAQDDIKSAAATVHEDSMVLITCENESPDGSYQDRRLIFAEVE